MLNHYIACSGSGSVRTTQMNIVCRP